MSTEEIRVKVSLIDNITAKSKKIVQKMEGTMNGINRYSTKISQQFKRNEGRFQGWALSIMFFGMAIQRVFTSIWKQSATTFNSVMHSVEGTVTGFDMLTGSMKYLWYVVGDALEPLATSLIPIITRWTEWLEENEELVRSVTKLGFEVGSVLTVSGILILGFNGLISAGKNLHTVLVLVGGTFFRLLGLIPGVTTAFMFLRREWLLTSTVGQFMAGGIIVGIIAAIAWIGTLIKNMGGFLEFGKSVARGVLRAFAFLGEGITWIFGKIGEGFVWLLNEAISTINSLITLVNKIPGINIGTIGKIEMSTSDFGDTFLKDYANWEKNSVLSPSQGYTTNLGDTLKGGGDSNTQPMIFKLDTSTTDAFLKGEEVELAYGSAN